MWGCGGLRVWRGVQSAGGRAEADRRDQEGVQAVQRPPAGGARGGARDGPPGGGARRSRRWAAAAGGAAAAAEAEYGPEAVAEEGDGGVGGAAGHAGAAAQREPAGKPRWRGRPDVWLRSPRGLVAVHMHA